MEESIIFLFLIRSYSKLMGEMLRLIFHNPGIIKLEEIGSRLVGIEEEEEAYFFIFKASFLIFLKIFLSDY